MNHRYFIRVILVLCISLFTLAFGGNAIAVERHDGLTYDQVRGTGLANLCPEIAGSTRGRGLIPMEPGKTVKITDLCLQPTEFYVKEESASKRKAPEFVPAKLVTRKTTSLDYVQADVTLQSDGSLTLEEKEGLDYQPITVQMPGGERIAILFTIKGYKAKTQPGLNGIGTSANFEGTTDVPTYRGPSFIDPKGRGLSIGYDAAEALPARRDEFGKKSVKDDTTYKGDMSLQIAKLSSETGEIAGTFECEQFSGTDLGAVEPHEVKIRGVFYGKVS
ncbi:photosystem II manganese-stabilizing polypeptide [Pseudanabaena sp. PCC 6802]|uniref:photosystem II manganese-stabilizing polypeptide n=1 Tax=Pseudanabaena sp. PCC 6802 TaxID=118173 RepID=UPI00034DF122|nr:photosystem II manganese-stabilizing polypeptide [Pseudanabaena sp. PCC 6802]